MGYQNFYATKLTNAIGAADTSIVVDQAPTATSGRLVLEARNPTQREIIKYTDVAGNTLTGVTRGQGGTTAKSHLKGALVEMNATGEDLQDILDAFASFTASNNDWRAMINLPNVVTYNGNNNYTLQFNGVDLRPTIQQNTKLKIVRTSAAPTQMTDLESASSQYWKKTSPTGISFTDQFTVIARVRPESYTGSAAMTVIDRRPVGDASGFGFGLDTNGTLRIYAGASSVYDLGNSTRRAPIGRCSVIAGSMKMSTTSAALYIDGEQLQSYYTNSAATAITQAGDLQIGASQSATLEPFDGAIQQVALFNAVLTPAQIKAYSSTPLTGSEPNCVGFWSFNGNGNDATANANNMTAQNSAGFITDSSFAGGADTANTAGTTEYAVVTTRPGYSGGNTTMNVQLPHNGAFPAVAVISSISYSMADTPHGFPDKSQFDILYHLLGVGGKSTNTGSVAGAWSTIDYTNITLPQAIWELNGRGVITGSSGTAATFGVQTQWDTVTPIFSRENQSFTRANVATNFQVYNHIWRETIDNRSAPATYTMYAAVTGGSGAQSVYIEPNYSLHIRLRLGDF